MGGPGGKAVKKRQMVDEGTKIESAGWERKMVCCVPAKGTQNPRGGLIAELATTEKENTTKANYETQPKKRPGAVMRPRKRFTRGLKYAPGENQRKIR